MTIMVQSKEAQIFNLNIELKEIVREKQAFTRIIKAVKGDFQKGFSEMKERCDKLISFYKGRIWEMERMLERHPITEKDYKKIK